MSNLKNTCDTYLPSFRHLLDVPKAGKKDGNDKDIIKPNVILLYNSGNPEQIYLRPVGVICTQMGKIFVAITR